MIPSTGTTLLDLAHLSRWLVLAPRFQPARRYWGDEGLADMATTVAYLIAEALAVIAAERGDTTC